MKNKRFECAVAKTSIKRATSSSASVQTTSPHETMQADADIPANPRRQRAVLVILVERREVPPLRVAAHDLRQCPISNIIRKPSQPTETGLARDGLLPPPPRPKTCRREKYRDKSRLQQHSIRLVPENSCAALTKERKHTEQIASTRRPEIQTSAATHHPPSQQIRQACEHCSKTTGSVGAYQ